MVEYTNFGNFVLPIEVSVLGKEYLLYVSAYITAYNFLVWTHGIHLFQGKNGTKKDFGKKFLKILFNSNILTILFGVFLFFTKLSLPNSVALAISDLGKMIGSISMLNTRIVLGGIQLKKKFSYKRIYLFFPAPFGVSHLQSFAYQSLLCCRRIFEQSDALFGDFFKRYGTRYGECF